MWEVKLQTDVIKGQYSESHLAWMYYEFHYILATNGTETYIHFCSFRNDWERANWLLEQILATPNFSPKNRSDCWYPIVDRKPIRPAEMDYRKLLLKVTTER